MCTSYHTTLIFCNDIEKELCVCLHNSWSKLFEYLILPGFVYNSVKVIQVEAIEYS